LVGEPIHFTGKRFCTESRAQMCHSQSGGDAERETLECASATCLITNVRWWGERTKVDRNGPFSSSMARSTSQTDCPHSCVSLKTAGVGYAASARFRVAKDVSVLRVNHAAVQVVLPGVREVARARDKIGQRTTLSIGRRGLAWPVHFG